MNNRSDAERWLKDAKDCLKFARIAKRESGHRACVQNSQLAVEMSAKAVISIFTEPEWKHDPGDQLKDIVALHAALIAKTHSPEMIGPLKTLAEDATAAAPWHGWATYGKKGPSGMRLASVEACTPEVARDLYRRARRSCKTAQQLLKSIPPVARI